MDHRRSLRIWPAAFAACLLCACATQPALHYDQAFDMPQLPTPSANGAIFHAGYDTGLFQNPTAHNVGDIVTILLQESTTAQKSSQTDTAKATKDSLSAPSLLGIPMSIHGHSFLSGSINNANSFSGAGDSKQSDSLVGAITVTVVRRLPNGNLVVRGQKLVQINTGEEYVRLQGIIRPVDIAPDNTISSQDVADAQIAYGQTGALADANQPGLLSRFFNSPWLPF
jgi:flagellar L-ring protein precursor FlgH